MRVFLRLMAVLVLWFAQDVPVRCHAAHSGLKRSTRLRLEFTGGFREELRFHLRFAKRAGIKYRFRDGVKTASIYLEGSGFADKVILGDFRLLSGDGLLFGDPIRFYRIPGNSMTSHGPMKAVPTSSAWNMQRGVFVSMRAGCFAFSTAVFKRPGFYDYASSRPVALGSFSIEKRNTTGGIGILLPLQSAVRLQPESPVVFLNAASVRTAGFASAEVNAIRREAFFSLSAGAGGDMSVMVRLFRSPAGYSAGDWLDMSRNGGIMQGATMRVWLRKALLRPSLDLTSFMSSREDNARRRNLVETCIEGGRKGGVKWKISLAASYDSRSVYRKSYLGSMRKEESRGESVVKLDLRARSGAIAHLLGTDFYFGGYFARLDGMSMDLACRVNEGPVDFALNVHAYTGRPRTMVVFRRGIGSFEYFSLVHGRYTDVSAGLKVEILPGVRFAAYYCKPWLRGERIYWGVTINY